MHVVHDALSVLWLKVPSRLLKRNGGAAGFLKARALIPYGIRGKPRLFRLRAVRPCPVDVPANPELSGPIVGYAHDLGMRDGFWEVALILGKDTADGVLTASYWLGVKLGVREEVTTPDWWGPDRSVSVCIAPEGWVLVE